MRPFGAGCPNSREAGHLALLCLQRPAPMGFAPPNNGYSWALPSHRVQKAQQVQGQPICVHRGRLTQHDFPVGPGPFELRPALALAADLQHNRLASMLEMEVRGFLAARAFQVVDSPCACSAASCWSKIVFPAPRGPATPMKCRPRSALRTSNRARRPAKRRPFALAMRSSSRSSSIFISNNDFSE